jgi:DNA-binding GntR family transcriptional regulator
MMGGKTELYETLKRQILTLELEPDQDLDEVALSKQYGISRTPVRDVFRQLAGEGYVDIRENRGARVIPMNHASLRDFFFSAPMIYEAVGRLAVHNFKAGQLKELEACQKRFCSSVKTRDAEGMVIENNRFHEIMGEMANNAFLKPSLGKLLIDHARIGYTFFRPTSDAMEADLVESCKHHDKFIEAIAAHDEQAVVDLVFAHWELSRQNMEIFIAPQPLKSSALSRMSKKSGTGRG